MVHAKINQSLPKNGHINGHAVLFGSNINIFELNQRYLIIEQLNNMLKSAISDSVFAKMSNL